MCVDFSCVTVVNFIEHTHSYILHIKALFDSECSQWSWTCYAQPFQSINSFANRGKIRRTFVLRVVRMVNTSRDLFTHLCLTCHTITAWIIVNNSFCSVLVHSMFMTYIYPIDLIVGAVVTCTALATLVSKRFALLFDWGVE